VKIEQQIYTRGKKGLFRQTEGYDTIHKSPGLTKDFIKKFVHPYCTYSPSKNLKKINAPASHYPPSLTIVNYPCGRMLVSQAVYVPFDFTGQRSTFFVHSYVIPPEAVDFNILLNIQFLTNLQELSSLDALPVSNNHIEPSREAEPLIPHVIEAVENSKQIYIQIDDVLPQLAYLYSHLPEHIKHRLGVCTYAIEPENRKGIHLIVLEKGIEINSSINLTKPLIKSEKESILTKRPKAVSVTGITDVTDIPPEKFFSEIIFWKARLGNTGCIAEIEETWIDYNLDNLTISQLNSIPEAFNNHMLLNILKTAAESLTLKKPFDLRYFLGSYPLTCAEYNRVIKILRTLYVPYKNDIRNIKFLFRTRNTGKLDENGLKLYLGEGGSTKWE